jgi:two-component system, OmpR family, sensor histidine kinase MprB
LSLSRRLALTSALAVAVAIALASAGAYVAVRSKLRGEVDSSLRDRATEVRSLPGGGPGVVPPGGAPPPGPQGSVPPPNRDAARFGGATGVVQLIGPGGRAIGGPGPRLPVSAADRTIASGNGAAEIVDRNVRSDHLRILTAPLPGGGAIQVARPLDEVDSVLSDLVLILAAITVGGIVLAAVLGGAVSRASLAPVRRFTEETESVAGEADPSRRLPEGGDDELGRLARTYNSTLDALESSVLAQRRLVSDASHELRTPLASVKTNLEVLLREPDLGAEDRREISADLVGQVDELTLLVEDVVELARRGEREPISEDVALEAVVAEAVSRARRHAAEVHFAADLEPFTVCGDAERLGRAVTNLLDNAAKWSSPGGLVEVALQGGELVVRDHGPGIPEEDLPFVFDRFHRASAARGMQGSGLGLAIVREIAAAHGATLSAENAPGGGAHLRLDFTRGPTSASSLSEGIEGGGS